MKKSLIILAFLTSPLIMASSFKALSMGAHPVHDEISCKKQENSPLLKSFIIDDGNYLDCYKIKDFENILIDIKELASDAPNINLYIKNNYSNASFDMGEIIRVPTRLVFYDRFGNSFPSSFMASETVLAHEYGHALFNQRLKSSLFFKPLYNETKKLSRLELSIQKAYSAGNPGNIVSLYKKQHEKLLKKIKENKNQNKMRHIITAYNELFADLIAVLATNSKNAVTNALYFDEMDDMKYKMVLARSFNETSISENDIILTEGHALFSPTRQFIGENLWPSNNEEKIHLINTTFNIISSILEKRFPQDLSRLNPKAANKELINALKVEFKL